MNARRDDLDQEMARSVGYWLSSSAGALPDNPVGRDRLLDDVDRTPQRAHRWLPPIGRSGLRSTVSVFRYAPALLVLTLVGGFLLLSIGADREQDPVSPAGASASPSPSTEPIPGTVTHVTGTVIEQRVDATDQSMELVGDTYRRRGSIIVRDNQWSDPRLPSRMRFRVNSDEYLVEGVAEGERPWLGQGIATLTDAAGAWTGAGQLLEYPGGATHDEWYQLEGSGAYEGLVAILRNHNEFDAERQVWTAQWEGLIVEGELPPLPE